MANLDSIEYEQASPTVRAIYDDIMAVTSRANPDSLTQAMPG